MTTLREGAEMRQAVRRLTIQFTALIVVLLVLVGGLVFAIVSTSAAESNQRALADAVHVDSPHDAPQSVWVAILDHGTLMTSPVGLPGLPDEAAFAEAARTGQPVESQLDSAGRSYSVLTVPDGGRIVQVARDQHETQEELARLGWALVVSGLLAAGASAFIAAWMARRAVRPLANALALQRRFIADASHELRTPLTLLSTRAQLLRRQLTTAPVSSATLSDDLDEMVHDSQLLTEILEDLLLAADPREPVTLTARDLVATAEQAVSAARAHAASVSVSIERTGEAGEIFVIASPASLLRMLSALISNAVDHAQTSVRVDVTREGGDAVVRISDDGPGFPDQMRDHAFERFSSSRRETDSPGDSDTPSDSPRHYGLGLALVAEIAARYGGSVQIEPREDSVGATVTVRIPHSASTTA